MYKLPPSHAFGLLPSYCAFQVSFIPAHCSSSLSDLKCDYHGHPKNHFRSERNTVASAPACFSSLSPVWLATFTLFIQYLITVLRDLDECCLAQGQGWGPTCCSLWLHIWPQDTSKAFRKCKSVICVPPILSALWFTKNRKIFQVRKHL